MPFVRVRHKVTGDKFTISDGAVDDGHEVLDEPAVDLRGKPLRPEPQTTAKKKAAPASTPDNNTHKE